MARKKFKDLNLSDAFLFAAALENKDICELVLSCILGHSVHLTHVRAENFLLYNSDFRSVRLDVYAGDRAEVLYNLEMQNENQHNLAKRSRYHQAEMDVTSLEPGDSFEKLKPVYIIFICDFDPFGEGLYRYTFESRCLEKDFPLNDEVQKIFLNVRGCNSKNAAPELVHFLHYVTDSTDAFVEKDADDFVRRLHEKVRLLKESRNLEERYMLLGEWLDAEKEKGRAEGREEGREEGRAESRQRILALVRAMLADGRAADIARLEADEQFYQSMLSNYHISE